jgi:alkylation response protein AidB-like acyl-CoA dehydrogenase
MEVILREEHEELRRNVRRFLEEKSPMSEVRSLMETPEGYGGAVWSQMAGQLGLQGTCIPERFGGSGFGYVELGIVLEEMGRVLLCAPFFSTAVMAVATLTASGDEAAQEEFLPGIASGSTLATLAYAEGPDGWGVENVSSRAARKGGTWVLNGAKRFVLDGATAELILVVANTDEGLSLFAVNRQAPGIASAPLSTLDATRKQADLDFRDTPGRLVGDEGAAARYLQRSLALAAAALASEQVGGIERVLEMSVEYAKTRFQFGRPIGSFQAVKHKCADMLVAFETSKSASSYAAWAVDAGSDELAVAASLAKAYCSEAYLRCAAENIQIHGGIGFTWEHDAHLYFKRAKSTELFLGHPSVHRKEIARLVGM